MLPSLYYFY